MGFYQGLGTSLMGIAPFIGIKMSSFDYLMTNYSPEKGNKNIVYYNLAIGGLAGAIAVTFTYPTDLVRKLMQLNGVAEGHNYSGLGDCIK